MKKKKKKRYKVNKRKLLSRLFFLIIVIALIIILLNSGSDKKKYDISVIVNNVDVTNSLKKNPYFNKDGVLYLSLEDIKEIFDENIYYEEESNKIITTYATRTSAIDIGNNTVELTSSVTPLSASILEFNNDYYIPITETTYLYNLEAKTGEDYAIISSLHKGLSTTKVTKKDNLKEEAKGTSSTIKKLEEGEELTYIESVKDGEWAEVLTNDGKIRICKN